MVKVSKTYRCELNSETRKNIDYWIEDIKKGASSKNLHNYIAKLAKRCFDKGMEEAAK